MADDTRRRIGATWSMKEGQEHLCWGHLYCTHYDQSAHRLSFAYTVGRATFMTISDASEQNDLDLSSAEITRIELRVPLKEGDGFCIIPVDLADMREERLNGAKPVGDGSHDDCGFVDTDGDLDVVGRASIPLARKV